MRLCFCDLLFERAQPPRFSAPTPFPVLLLDHPYTFVVDAAATRISTYGTETVEGVSHRWAWGIAKRATLVPCTAFSGATLCRIHRHAADYTGKGGSLANVIHTIKTNPNDRRIVLTVEPADLGIMALPPCHMFCQFMDTERGELSCQMYQRSCDMGWACPSISRLALLTCMIAHCCHLKPGDFVHTMGDTHVYSNHVEALKTQLEREPRPFPTLKINPDVRDIDSFKMSDFTIEGYNPCQDRDGHGGVSCSRPQLCKVGPSNIVASQRIWKEACSLSLCLFLQRRQRAAIGGVYLFLPLNKLPIIEELFDARRGAGASAASALDL